MLKTCNQLCCVWWCVCVQVCMSNNTNNFHQMCIWSHHLAFPSPPHLVLSEQLQPHDVSDGFLRTNGRASNCTDVSVTSVLVCWTGQNHFGSVWSQYQHFQMRYYDPSDRIEIKVPKSDSNLTWPHMSQRDCCFWSHCTTASWNKTHHGHRVCMDGGLTAQRISSTLSRTSPNLTF